MSKTVLGVIGGTGLYSIDGLKQAEWRNVHSSFGEASDALLFGSLEGLDIVFLPRHGRGHVLSPDAVNYRANVDALKRAGVTDIIAFTAASGLKEDLQPGDFVIPDQLIDQSQGREKSFFGAGLVAHVDMERPFSARLSGRIADAAQAEQLPCHAGGTTLAVNGPQLPTAAEAALYRSWGASLVSMTAMPEAALAREAELPYARIAMLTAKGEVLKSSVAQAQRLLAAVAKSLTGTRDPEPEIESALDAAVLTDPDSRAPVVVARLDAVAGRVLSSHS